MLWLVLAPGAKTFGPANAEPIFVDILPPQDVPHQAESPKSEEPKSELPKPELPRPAALKPPKPEPPKPGLEASRKPPPKSNSQTGAEDSVEDRAATAARLAWMLNLPTETTVSLSAPPSESKSNLASEEIARLKAQVSKCWAVPAGVPSTPGFEVLLRIALNPAGTPVADVDPRARPLAGLLLRSAKQVAEVLAYARRRPTQGLEKF